MKAPVSSKILDIISLGEDHQASTANYSLLNTPFHVFKGIHLAEVFLYNSALLLFPETQSLCFNWDYSLAEDW